MIRYCVFMFVFWLSCAPLMAGSDRRSATPEVILSIPGSFTAGMTILAATQTITVPTASAYQTGVTITQNTLSVSGSANATYTLQVRASGNLTSGANSIPASQIGITLTTAGIGSAGEKRLSTAYQTLGSYFTNAAFANFVLSLQYKLYSDSALLKPAGSYTTTLTFLFSGV